MSISRKPVISTELLASRRPFNNGVYVVGPFASRVSFSSQQRRAISLICDINEDLKKSGVTGGLTNKNVCVVGAGLAGVTCAVTAAALNANAYIVDKHPNDAALSGDAVIGLGQIMPTVRKASHRDAHPSLNFWPQEDVEPLTRLPMLNWHEGSCDAVSAQIAEQLATIIKLDGIGERLKGVVNGVKVMAVTEVKDHRFDHHPRWRLEIDPDSTGRPKDLAYDIVIFALGFGDESKVRGIQTPSYWTVDDDLVNEFSKNPPPDIQDYVVSGTGDGGLIEVIRLLFMDKRAGNLDEEIMNAISDDNFRQQVAMIESQANKLYADKILHGHKSDTNLDGRLSDEDKNEISCFLWEQYIDLVENKTSDKTVGGLKRRRSEIAKVTLIGRWEHPMELGASPYHRLLITIGINQGWIEYKRTMANLELENVVALGLDGASASTDGQIADVIYSAYDGRRDAGTSTRIAHAFFVARHGYISPLDSIWARDEVNRIRRQQYLYADQDQLNGEYARTIAAALKTPDPSDPLAFFKGHNDEISAYFKLRFGLDVYLVPDEYGQADRAMRIRRVMPSPPEATAVPLSLFGFKIVNRTQPDMKRSFSSAGVDS